MTKCSSQDKEDTDKLNKLYKIRSINHEGNLIKREGDSVTSFSI